MTKLKKRKKGFTLTELAIVIAVIAILIAVLVPTFISLINSANESADTQAVKSMNTELSMYENSEDFNTVADVVSVLAEDNYDLDNYTPLISGMQFYWIKSINRIVYANESTHEISYPSEYTSLTYTTGDWYSLNGDITLDNSWTVDNGKVEISSGAQFASLMNNFYNSSSSVSTVTTIELTDNVDLMGACYNFGILTTSQITKLTIEGNNHTIYGFRDDTNSFFGQNEFANKGYAYGLFKKIDSGVTVEINGVNFDGMVVEDTLEDNGTMALISGYVNGTLIMTNVTFTNCSVKGYQKVSTIAAQLNYGGTISLDNVDFENTSVYASSEGAKVVAYIYASTNKSTLKYKTNCDFSGITVYANDGLMEYYGSTAISSFTATLNGYECVFMYHSRVSSGERDRGDIYLVTTQALFSYAYSTSDSEYSSKKTVDKYTDGTTITYGQTVSYNGETYYLRFTTNPGGNSQATLSSDTYTFTSR